MQSLLALDQLTIHYGATVAVQDLCLQVPRGEILGLLGPNGCGKSTTLAAISGQRQPTRGEIRVAGLREADAPLEYRRRVGVVPQELAVFEELSPTENLKFFGRLYGLHGKKLRSKVSQALDFVRLQDRCHQPTRTLSGGMQRRLNLACAILHDPCLLLLDEPTVGLDIQSREAIFESLQILRDQGCTIVFTTHHLEEAEQICDRAAIMDSGRLVALGSIADLLAQPAYFGQGRLVTLTFETERSLRAALGPNYRVEVDEGHLTINDCSAKRMRPTYVTPPARARRDLEGLILQLTGRSAE